MERVAVESKALKSLGYDTKSSCLEIEFHNGNVYRYEQVPVSVYEWLLRVPNKGGFITRVLEPKYGGNRVHEHATSEVDLEAALRASLEGESRD
jgi:hypothetical protein